MVAFALYGWYSSKELPNIIEKEIDRKIKELDKSYKGQLYVQQQVLQKMNAVYGIQDPDRKLQLLEEIIRLDPTTYNAYNTLAYVYWYEKKNMNAAEENFMLDLQNHPNNYQTMSDLVFLYTEYQEWRLAFKMLKSTLEIRPEAWKDFEEDSRILPLKEKMKEEYEDAINLGKINSSNVR